MKLSWIAGLVAAHFALALPQRPQGFQIQGNDTVVRLAGANSTVTVTIAPVTSTSTTTCTSGQYEFPTSHVGPLATLMPVIHEDHDLHDIVHLSPHCAGAGAGIHYAVEAQGDNAGIFAVATPKWTCPSVVLDHSSLIASVEVVDGVLIIHFADKASFDHCQSEWASGEMILVAYTEGCGDFHLGQRCYYHTYKIIFDAGSLTVLAFGQARAIEEVTIDINVWWGSLGSHGVSYGSPGSGSGSSSGGSSSGSGDGGSPTATTAASPSGTDCVAPVDTKYGLPTACLGPYFDEDLDSGLGYYNASSFDYSSVLEKEDVDNRWVTDAAQRRWAVWNSIVSSVRKFVTKTKDGIKEIAATVKEVAQAAQINLERAGKLTAQILEVSQTVAQLASNALLGKPNTFEKDFSKLLLPRPAKECDDDEKKGDTSKKSSCKPKDEARGVKTPWGDDAVLLKSIGNLPDSKDLLPMGGKKQTTVTRANFINFYCVSCGLTGSMKTKGNVTIQVGQGITEGFVEGDLDMSIGIGLGIYAQYFREDKMRKNLWDIPLSPFTLGFITVGPILSIGTELKYNLNVTGAVLARADVSIARAHFVYDFKDGGKMISRGFKPEFKPEFRADGEVTLAVQFGVPVALEFGVTTLNGCERCKGTFGIETMPSIKAATAMAVYVGYKNASNGLEAGLTALEGCKGISTTLSVRNDVSAVAKGFGVVEKNWTLYETKDYVLASWCIGSKQDTTKRSSRYSPVRLVDFENIEVRQDISNSSTAAQPPSSKTTPVTTVSKPLSSLGTKTAVQKVQTTSSNTDKLYDLTPYVVEEVDDLGFDGTTLSSVPYDLDNTDFEGYWFSTLGLRGSDGDLVLAACNDGNVYIQEKSTHNDLPFHQTCTTLWAGYGDAVVSTPTGEVLHYYENTMSVLNVSRLRTAEESHIPGTSVYVALTPFVYSPTDPSASLLAAVDPSGNLFFPAVCTYQDDDESAKLFLLGGDDIEAGLATLRSPDLTYSVTNGAVDECYLVFLDIAARERGAWAGDDSGARERYDADPLDVAFGAQDFASDGSLRVPVAGAGDAELSDLKEVYDDDEFDEEAI